MQLPKPSCPIGYTQKDLEFVFHGSELILAHFNKWMRGQTMSTCDGQEYNDEHQAYSPSGCAAHPHGAVVYPWDLERFLQGKPVID